MSIFILLYLWIIIGLIYSYSSLNIKSNSPVCIKYLWAWIIHFMLWIFLYLVSFTTSYNPEYLLYISRALYVISFCATIYISFFFMTYGLKPSHKMTIISRFIFMSLFILVLISLSSWIFIEKMLYNPKLNMYYEHFWFWFIFLALHYISNPIITTFIVLYRKKYLTWISKRRYMYLSWGYLIFLYLYAFFLAILPLFWIWIFQKEQIIFFIPFVTSLFYIGKRYKFFKIQIALEKIILFFSSIAFVYIILKIIKFSLSFLDVRIIYFWGLRYDVKNDFLDFLLVIFLFQLIYTLFNRYIIIIQSDEKVLKNIKKIREKLTFTKSKEELSSFLKIEGKKRLNILLELHFEIWKTPELEKYFLKDSSHDIFLHDSIFLEENKNKYSLWEILKELGQDISLYIPLYQNRTNLSGMLCIWEKSIKEFYHQEEIEGFQELAHEIEKHLKYLQTYKKLQDLSIQLDKKVDEKTMEYNTLLWKQKDFIAYVWHEIRNPITNSIFLSQSIEDAWKTKDFKNIQEDIEILHQELKKVSSLVKNIFSMEQFDLWKVKVLKSEIDFSAFLKNEIRTFEISFPDVIFQTKIQEGGLKEIDQIQMRQVIINLINNAIKFAHKESPKIAVILQKNADKIEWSIEDNGKWFQEYEIGSLFQKYASGNGAASWLGLWLYLCKRIVELHNGEISVSNGNILWWAKFTIRL